MFAINDGRSDTFWGILGFVRSLTTLPAKNACLLSMMEEVTHFGKSWDLFKLHKFRTEKMLATFHINPAQLGPSSLADPMGAAGLRKKVS